MPDRGKLAVASILVVALLLALFAWWWRWQQGHRSAEFWGPEAAVLIRTAEEVELLELQPVEGDEQPAGHTLKIDGDHYQVAERRDLRSSPGLIHARHSLVEDASFVWSAPAGDCQPSWSHAVLLTGDSRSATLVFDFRCEQVLHLDSGQRQTMVPRIAKGWERILTR